MRAPLPLRPRLTHLIATASLFAAARCASPTQPAPDVTDAARADSGGPRPDATLLDAPIDDRVAPPDDVPEDGASVMDTGVGDDASLDARTDSGADVRADARLDARTDSGVDTGVIDPNALPQDCSRAGSTSPLCDPAAARGTGTRLRELTGFSAHVGGGFLDGTASRLTLAVRTSTMGGVMEVDLANGNRRLVTGTLQLVGGGTTTAGSGAPIEIVADVQPAPDGSLYALSRNASGAHTVLRVDRATGARTVLVATSSVPCNLAGAATAYGIEPLSLAVGPDGSVYVRASRAGSEGIFRYAAGACQPVSASGTPARGAGPGLSSVTSLRFHEGNLYGVSFERGSLFRINPTTGDRAEVAMNSSIGIKWVHLSSTLAVTAGNARRTRQFAGVRTDTGAVADYASGLSGPASRLTVNETPSWPHPSRPWMLTAFEDGIVWIDTRNGNSNVVSN